MEFLVALHPVYKCTIAAIVVLLVTKLIGKQTAIACLNWSWATYERYNLIMGAIILVAYAVIAVGAIKFIIQLFS